jgi:hypothetical protein
LVRSFLLLECRHSNFEETLGLFGSEGFSLIEIKEFIIDGGWISSNVEHIELEKRDLKKYFSKMEKKKNQIFYFRKNLQKVKKKIVRYLNKIQIFQIFFLKFKNFESQKFGQKLTWLGLNLPWIFEIPALFPKLLLNLP